MTRLPPLDLHAHVDTSISSEDLTDLASVVFAVTRSLDEAEEAVRRLDAETVWGVGCHPGMSGALKAFSQERFANLLDGSSFAGELGMDGKARTGEATQRNVLQAALEVLADKPRIVSLHSYGATQHVVDLVGSTGVRAPILHWWLGDESETARAVELGCFFSVNSSGAKHLSHIGLIPIKRVLTETDHPFGDRRGSDRRPGNVLSVEKSLAAHYGCTQEDLRRQVWRNLGDLVAIVGCGRLLPRRIRSYLATLPRPS